MDVEYVWENGRRYCGSYFMPNDRMEQTRLLLVHQVFMSAFNDEPTTVPLVNPSSILDVGTGTGEWAVEMADRYPDCEVTGIDIVDVFPRYIAPNLFWEVDNAELEWLRPPDLYDLVHFRHMDGAFRDWRFVYEQAFKVCKPGGWIEISDYDDIWCAGNYVTRISAESDLHFFAQHWKDAAAETGYLIGATHLEPQFLRDVGCVDVVLTKKEIPISPGQMSTGHLFMKALLEGLEAYSLRLLTKQKGFTAEEVRAAITKISKEFREIALDPLKSKNFVVKIKVLTGKKPLQSQN
jgi:SAM-dependent methyltransferase